MAHFAEIDDANKVIRVVVADTKEWCEQHLGGRWVQTSYNTEGGVHRLGGQPLRKNFAGPGMRYDADLDAFIPRKPHPDATLDRRTCLWSVPVAVLAGNGPVKG